MPIAYFINEYFNTGSKAKLDSRYQFYLLTAMQQRKFPRHPTEIPLQVKIVSPQESETLETVCAKNISTGGLAFSSQQEWSLGTIINILIASEPNFEFLGRVVWCQAVPDAAWPFDVGIEFVARKANLLESLLQIESYQALLNTQATK